MLGQPEFSRDLRLDGERVRIFVDRGWVSPPIVEGRPVFREIDVARCALIADLVDAMGVNDEGVDIVLDLLDQLYSLRSAFNDLIDALEIQMSGVGLHDSSDPRSFDIPARKGPPFAR